MRRHAAVLALLLVATGLPGSAGAQVADGGPCLDIEPETAAARTGSPIYLVATLRRKVEGETACNGALVERGYARLIDFEITGDNDPEVAGVGSDTPESPDATCEVNPGHSTEPRCIVAVWGDDAGVSTVRAWIDDDREDPPEGVVEADRTEGADKAAEPGNGCVGAEDPGGGEPDCTDVVEIEWRDLPPCEPDEEPQGNLDRIAVYRYGEGVERGIYTIDHRGGSPRRLGAPEDLRHFLWSPDHRKLALTTGYIHSLELSVMDVADSDVVALTDDFMVDEGAAWSPDSRRLVFASFNYRRSRPARLKVLGAGGGKAKWITREKVDSRHPDWSPNGKLIVYTSFRIGGGTVGNIDVIAPDGTGRRTLVRAKGLFAHPQFSPNGKKVLYGKYLEKTGAHDLFVVDLAGRVERLTKTGLVVADYEWSPDGRTIAYETTSNAGWNELHVIDADGSDDRRIARHFGLGISLRPSWSPDSSLVAYQLPDWPYDPDSSGLASDVWVGAADGSCAEAITPTPDVTEVDPTWIAPSASSNPYEL